MAKVTILNHGSFTDKKSGVYFSPVPVQRGEARILLGQAVVDDEVAREHFVTRPGIFLVEDLEPTEEEKAAIEAQIAAEAEAAKASAEAEAKAKPAKGAK